MFDRVKRAFSASVRLIANSSGEVRLRKQVYGDMQEVMDLEIVPAAKLSFLKKIFNPKEYGEDGVLFYFSPNGSKDLVLGVTDGGRVKSLKIKLENGNWENSTPAMFDFNQVAFGRLVTVKTRHGFAKGFLPNK